MDSTFCLKAEQMIYLVRKHIRFFRHAANHYSIEISIFCNFLEDFPLFSLKLVSAILIKTLFFQKMIALQKLWKILFISSESSFRSWDTQIFEYFHLPLLFLPVGHCNVIICQPLQCHHLSKYKNLITHFVWYQ